MSWHTRARVARAYIFPFLIVVHAAPAAGQIAWHRVKVPPGAVRPAYALDDVIVTASREAQRRAETPATVDVVTRDEIERLHASHPSELMGRVPGVVVNVTGGEGHMMAMRQPITTNPVYLYLENGVPTRSTGFFNHNALYEIDVPHAERIEVLKGPATALYGSDAIGGLVNVLTRAPEDATNAVSLEAGPYGYARLLAEARFGNLLGELNVTRTDGWRDGTAYDRESGSLRYDASAFGGTLRSLVTFSRIDQATAGTSALPATDYENQPRRNLTPISYRAVEALRVSAAYERISGNTLWSVTPFVRWNRMEILPNWTLTFDPAIWETGHASAGALLKVRHDAARLGFRAIAGLDVDYSPGSHREWRIQPTRAGAVFTSYTRGDVIYDYDVTFGSASPYVQLELTPLPATRVVAGLRYDVMGYSYDNPLGDLQTGSHRRPASTDVDFSHLSPKLGVAWSPKETFHAFASYSHGFRAPSEGQLFRQGRALSTTDLAAISADNLEAGIGGALLGRVDYQLSVYDMRKQDDILTFTHPDGSTETMNAGETRHRGIEAGVGVVLTDGLRVDATWSRAYHTYEDWRTRQGEDFSGRDIEAAPERTALLALSWSPAQVSGAHLGIELQHVGPYWMDAANTHRYEGHTVSAVRAEAPVTERIRVHAKLSNLLDARFAELAQYTVARGVEYAPGMPRTLQVGVRVQ